MSLLSDLQRFDEAERKAFVTIHQEHPEISTEELTTIVAEQFRPRWFALLRAAGHPVDDPRETRKTP